MRPQAAQLKARTEGKHPSQRKADKGGPKSQLSRVSTQKKPEQARLPAKSGAKNAKPSAAPKVQQTVQLPPQRKVPEALPLKNEWAGRGPISRITSRVFKKPAIQEIVREPTAGGIVFRMSRDNTDIEILLIQDSKGRWTIPKGHIEPGETAKQTAIREIGEESGLFHIQVLTWLGKIHFQYRRVDRLVLMTTQIYLVRAMDDAEIPTKEQWMKGIKWFKFNDAIDAIEYEDIEKLMLLAKNKIRQGI